MATPCRNQPSLWRTLALGLMTCGVGVFASGCVTGPRPSFDDQQPADSTTGNQAIDDVLARLDAATVAEFTADYEITTRLGDTTSTATVVQAPESRRSITVNGVRFLYDQGPVATCDLTTGECEASINDARISDVGLTHRFYAEDFARRLRIDANRRIGEPVAHSITAGGLPALCVDVPVSGGIKTYCALADGPLAHYDGNDVVIDLTSYATTIDESAFATG
jgi:hypothetical protein